MQYNNGVKPHCNQNTPFLSARLQVSWYFAVTGSLVLLPELTKSRSFERIVSIQVEGIPVSISQSV